MRMRPPRSSLMEGGDSTPMSPGSLKHHEHIAESSGVAIAAATSASAAIDPTASANAESGAAAAAVANNINTSEATASQHTTATNPTTTTTPSTNPPPQAITPFRPVHAWIRTITSPRPLGLERCRPYGAWSVLRVMRQRIPGEFTVRDTTNTNTANANIGNGNNNRTAFETLAEAKAEHCKLCLEEVKDVVECLVDADYRSAFLPRKSDGRLIGHVALENGWPCKDLFSRKKSATCA